jgi:transcriptional regulator with PAS, ATPase and Fis domain
VTENCSAIPESLLESTLFGHVKGAFTGASHQRAGLFEVAHGGTLFLDEVADMSLPMQAKLLRVLESGEVRRVGQAKPFKVDVRVLVATHKDLEMLVRSGKFREDLWYRLNVIAVRVPPLRERVADIPLLVRHFLSKHGNSDPSLKRPKPVTLSDGALQALIAHPWPGNVRQLENEVRRALVLADHVITEEHLSLSLSGKVSKPSQSLKLRERVDALEAELLKRALSETSGNQTRAAQVLGISRFGLQKMLKRLALGSDTRLRDPSEESIT